MDGCEVEPLRLELKGKLRVRRRSIEIDRTENDGRDASCEHEFDPKSQIAKRAGDLTYKSTTTE